MHVVVRRDAAGVAPDVARDLPANGARHIRPRPGVASIHQRKRKVEPEGRADGGGAGGGRR